MAIYKIWCKEKSGTEGAEAGDMISAMDWPEVRGNALEVTEPTSLAGITNADTLRIFAHGSIDKVGGRTAKELAHYLYDHGLRHADKIELVACDTAVNTRFKKAFAQRLLAHLVSKSDNKQVSITGTKGASGSLAPSRDGVDTVTVKGKDLVGDAGKKSYSLTTGCFGQKAVST